MTDVDKKRLLTDDDLLKLPWYACGRRGKTACKTTIFRHRKYGLQTPDGTRRFLRGIRVAGGFVYDEAEVRAFWRDVNGDDPDAAPSITPTAIINDMDAAEREMADAGYARAS